MRYNLPMSIATSTTGEQLAGALHALGVKFIMGGGSEDKSLHKRPVLLIGALAESQEARLRLSLIPLFLEHPEFAAHVRTVAKKLDPSARLTLQCYYSAAVWLGQKYQADKKTLPDYFSKELNLSLTNNPNENLHNLSERHKQLSHTKVNWLGTYEHAVQNRFRHTRPGK